MKKVILTLLLFIGVFNCSIAQIDYTQKDFDLFTEYVKEFSEYRNMPMDSLTILTAKHFLGIPYVAATLEKGETEELVVNLQKLDCTTFVENVIALTKVIKDKQHPTFADYTNLLKSMRYREGIIDGYTSRIHYTSEWVAQNSNIFQNISLQLGGTIMHKPLSFMTSNAHLYPKLKGNESNISKLEQIETSLSNKANYVVISRDKIEGIVDKIKDGDIIIFATSVSGLDYSHIGFAYWEDDTLRLLHASSIEKKVIVDKKSLVEYCNTSRSCTGITVLRLKN